ncbi:hypothetical protein PFICI_12141 [Pestalotiopsis fici W106-1]|uniref:SET domain-containing protein n=1 Tax=Pestalotiopsis fici (strain W106-1 / CGMCC3.15140) TaxID=1229662 RepID=W3WSH8_PESFW|nr:uncharacterized protein PFICI_12141 [Pestalotiopsis fici W106-1]ETS76754.1 hypothetical protein PFICI_12141 [Pestalotiopsis fici W106-1]
MKLFHVLGALHIVGGAQAAKDHVVASLAEDYYGSSRTDDLLLGGAQNGGWCGLHVHDDDSSHCHGENSVEYHAAGDASANSQPQPSGEDDEAAIEEASRLWPISTPCAPNGTRAYCVYTHPGFASGRGISILTSARTAIAIAKSVAFSAYFTGEPAEEEQQEEQRGFLLNLGEDESSPLWRVQEMPGKGKGLIAQRNLEAGDHIMSTTPSVMIDYNLFTDLAEADELMALQVAAVEGGLSDAHRGIFMALSTHDDDFADHAERVSKIIHTNSFDITLDGIVPKNDEGVDENFYTVFPEISRMNHDCRPNAEYYFDPATFAQHVHAARPIAAGEEITISYIDPIQTRQDRLDRLDNSWHFPCSCSACMQNRDMTAASDARIHQILEIRKQLREWAPSSQATPAMAELMISLYEQERLWTMLYEAYTYAAIEYNGAGEPWAATKYARLAVQRGLASGGPNHSDVHEMEALARNPWEHWSWMLRTRKRMNWEPHAVS